MEQEINNVEEDPAPPQDESLLIQAIAPETVHRICSGQVVLSLSIAMKELVENAIDAGARIIDIRLKEYGADLVEVSDNGTGVIKENFQTLTLKHYTSKIKAFSDLEQVGTLGFRGEALSSLCALADLTVVTRHKSDEVATKISYDKNGKIKKQVAFARQQGTTVSLENLFSTLPVRRKEFLKNLKREFNKMCQLLHAYCLVSKGIKFTCTNVTSKGSKSTVVATEGHSTVRENIISVFGPKQISALIDVDLKIPDEQILGEYNLKLENDVPFTFEFMISSVTHGSGRSANDRQFFYINSRPCEPTKLMKIVNEVYKQFNSHQYPFVYLDIKTKDGTMVDVNVTPDKRQVFLEKEKLLLAVVKFSLLEAFKNFPSTFKIQNTKTDLKLRKSLTESCLKRKGSILETFKKRSKTESNIGSIDFNLNESLDLSEESDDDKTDANLDTILKIACDLRKKDSKENIAKNVEIKIDTPNERKRRKSIKVKTSMEQIKSTLKQRSVKQEVNELKVKFRCKIDPESNKGAEEELQKQISKDDFVQMQVVGQFNLGFIIARLNSDLFIIDQHATDEKYNFEQLQLTTVMSNQKLVNPKRLELTAGDEALLIEHEEVFNKNGFQFQINHNEPSTKKVSLVAVPLSKNFIFGKDDIDEMLFMLQHSGNTLCRPSRVRAMFASRACRKSVMIGKHLSTSDMKKLIVQMSEIDQPWNCPHGRPTMRHLINLDMIQVDE